MRNVERDRRKRETDREERNQRERERERERLPSGTLCRSAMVGKSPTCPLRTCCGAHFDTTHALQCPTGGFTRTRHRFFSEVTVEPSLVPVTGEQFELRSASTVTVRRGSTSLQADSLLVGLNQHFLTYGFLAPSPVLAKAPSTPSTAAKSKRSAENMVNEYVSMHHLYLWFSPCTGGAGPAATTFLKRLADRISSTHQLWHNEAIVWLRTRLSFALLRSSLICIRRSRPHRDRSRRVDLNAVPVATSETRI